MSVYTYRQRYLRENPRKCEACGVEPEELHVHHIDGDRDNGDIDNLVGLCMRCHRAVHIDTYSGDHKNIVELREALGNTSTYDGARSRSRKQRLQFSLSSEIVERLDEEQNMSQVVEDALWNYYE